MKSLILTILTFILTTILLCAQGKWEIVNEGSDLSIWEIDFVNVNTAWALGSEGIQKTNDGGNTWLSIGEGEPWEFYAIDFLNDSIGWALKGGFDIDSLQIHKSLDGGQTWVHQKSVNYGEALFDNNIYAVNDSIVYVLAESLLKTIDGGTSWMDVTPPGGYDFRKGSFLNADKGVVIGRDDYDGKSLFRTFNGGEDWVGKAIPEFSEICEINFLKDSLGHFRAREYSSMNYRLFKTTDSFNSWVAVTDEKYSIYGCHFSNDDQVISIMEDSTGTNLMKSEDGGGTWEHWGGFKLPANWGYQFHFFGNIGYLICKGGGAFYREGHLILRTVNLGLTWEVLDFSYPLKDVSFINETKGLLAGGSQDPHHWDGSLIRTDDGFKTFDFPLGKAGGAQGGPFRIYRSCHFIGDSVGFYTNGYLMKTSDGGESWIRDNTFEYNVVKDICFIDNSLAYTISEGDIDQFGLGIYKTTNGGQFWDKFHSWEDVLVNSIFFIDENTGWVLGWSGDWFENPDSDGRPVIIKYSEDKGWRGIPTEANLPLNKIYFVDHDHGWILGGYSNPWEDRNQPLLLRSVDGGESWTEVTGMDYIIHDIHFETIDHGWSVGEGSIGRGAVLETFDGGLNWEVAIDSLSGSLRALHIQNGHGWAVGDNGLILKYSPLSANRFMVVGDAHHYSPVPDFNKSMLYELTMAAIEEEVDFIFFTGDLGMQTFNTPEEQDSVLKDWRFVLDTLYHHNINVYACRGNVDVSGREAWDSLFSDKYAFPQNGPDLEKNLSYAIEYDNLKFLALDQYTDAHKINQVWLDSILSISTSKYIFAAGHEPAFKLLNPGCMNAFPEERNLFWESLTEAGALTYFSGHDHFYDHTIIDDGDSNPDNDIHQVIVGTGGGSIFSDSEYNGENGRWTPKRLFHEEEHGYVLLELNDEKVELTWKHRIGPNEYVNGGDSYTFTNASTSADEIQIENDVLINYPNPFHSRTIISYQLQATTDVELSIYDLSGRKVSTLIEERQAAGKYDIEWHSNGLEPGIYLCEMRTQKRQQVIKMILLE